MAERSEEVLLVAEHISKSFGDTYLFNDISLSIHRGEKVALIAKNGAGKSTFLQILVHQIDFDQGEVTTQRNLELAYLAQAPAYAPDWTIMQALEYDFKDTLNLLSKYETLLLQDNDAELHLVMNQIDAHQAWNLPVRINQMLGRMKLNDATQTIGTLSGGQVKRLALASVLLKQPDLLILDEPTNHLDIEMIEWLEDYLMDSTMSLLMVTHDRYFLDRVCNRIVELEDSTFYNYYGNYEYYLEKRDERVELKNTEIDKARQLYKKELEWVNRMPKARTTKAKYRVDKVDEIKVQASQRKNNSSIKIDLPMARLGQKIIDLYHIYHAYDELKLITDFTFKFAKGEKVGIVGKNGSGKSTLLNIISEKIKPTQGYLEIGSTVKIGYYHQDGIQFEPYKRVIDIATDIMEVVDFGDGRKINASAFLNFFLFPPKVQQTKVDKLSGGEKRRLYLMSILMHNPNFLILDEPTNDLDIVTLNVLENYLLQFEGCVLVVSHDRYFTDKIVDHLFVFEGEGKIRDFPGNYTQYRYEKLKQDQERIATQSNKIEVNSKVQIKNDYSQRLSYKEKLELDQLEKELHELGIEKTKVEAVLSSSESDHSELVEMSHRYEALKIELDQKELRWLELSEKA
jgi:ATP-binding cassette subfamily F protein uup